MSGYVVFLASLELVPATAANFTASSFTLKKKPTCPFDPRLTTTAYGKPQYSPLSQENLCGTGVSFFSVYLPRSWLPLPVSKSSPYRCDSLWIDRFKAEDAHRHRDIYRVSPASYARMIYMLKPARSCMRYGVRVREVYSRVFICSTELGIAMGRATHNWPVQTRLLLADSA